MRTNPKIRKEPGLSVKHKPRAVYLLIIALASCTFYTRAQTVMITGSAGWLESAYVTWQPFAETDSFSVYYSGEGIVDRRIDDQLIRDYGDHYRADILGMEAGSYTIKVVPVIEGEESEAAETGPVSVDAYDRTGYSFRNGRLPGAYNFDGTPRDGAVILYISENTKNSISLEVTGANSNPCVGLETILEGFKKGNDNRPLIVRLVGQITDPEYTDKGDIVIENDNNTSGYITFEGVGEDAVADGWGIRVKNASNIEIRNIGLMNCNSDEGDNIGLQQNNDYIWVHNCDFFYGDAGSDADQAKGDGALDVKKSTYITISYNHFWDSGKSNLLGLGEGTTSGLFITYHHNWYDHSDSRHPRVRYYSAHVYNNYYDGNAKYGVGSTLGSSVFVESNYFRNCKYPILISMQGSDVFDESLQVNDYSDMPTFSKEDGGIIKALNNYMTGQKRFVAYGDTDYPDATVDFDAYVASTRDETVSTDVKSTYGGNTYNNFDTDPARIYEYSADSPEQARDRVMELAGRLNGGDFVWTFNNASDDASSDVDPDLKSALVNYTTALVSIQGDGTVTGDTTGSGGGTGGGSTGDVFHNFTESGTSSSFFSITGNLSDSKGTVSYAGDTLTRCLKIESTTSVSFTIESEATLTLVLNDDFSGKIKINGVSYSASAGILTRTIQAGSYEITKDEIANLFYMSIEYSSTGVQRSSLLNCRLFPNPVSDILRISAGSEIESVKIYTLSGSLAKQVNGNCQNIDLSEMCKGSYLVMVRTREGIAREIIIKD